MASHHAEAPTSALYKNISVYNNQDNPPVKDVKKAGRIYGRCQRMHPSTPLGVKPLDHDSAKRDRDSGCGSI
jgi:hypothetical protein